MLIYFKPLAKVLFATKESTNESVVAYLKRFSFVASRRSLFLDVFFGIREKRMKEKMYSTVALERTDVGREREREREECCVKRCGVLAIIQMNEAADGLGYSKTRFEFKDLWLRKANSGTPSIQKQEHGSC